MSNARTALAWLMLIPGMGFAGSVAVFTLGSLGPQGGVIGGVKWFIGFPCFVLNLPGMKLLMMVWKPEYRTSEGMQMLFWIVAILINWLVVAVFVLAFGWWLINRMQRRLQQLGTGLPTRLGMPKDHARPSIGQGRDPYHFNNRQSRKTNAASTPQAAKITMKSGNPGRGIMAETAKNG